MNGAGNTFKASAKPVLIGTAVVGSTTMIFSIVIALTHSLQPALLANLSILHPPFLLGLIADSKRVVAICTLYAQRGTMNIFVTVFCVTLGFAFLEPYFFIGNLISIALFGLYQAIFLANAGGAWDNAKKIVETELKEKGTDLHSATVIGEIVGDPFKDTSSVALHTIIKFKTLFGLLAVDLAVSLSQRQGALTTRVLAVAFLSIALYFAWRSFYRVRIAG